MKKSSYTLRAAVKKDIKAIYSLYMHPKINPQMDYEVMSFEEFCLYYHQWQITNQYYVMTSNEKIVAVTYLRQGVFRQDHIMYVGGFAVKASLHGQGIGSLFLTELLNLIKENSIIERAELIVNSDNAAAIRVYEKLGFKSEGTLFQWIKNANGSYLNCEYMVLFLRDWKIKNRDIS